MSMNVDEQYALITKNLAEVIEESEIKDILRKEGKLKIYWGTATTGKPHIGYFVPIFKLSDYLKAGCEVTVLLADLHGLLDNLKTTFELLDARVKYYEFIIRAMLNLIGVDQSKLKFVRGTDFQLQPKYTLDMYKLTTHLTTTHCERAGDEVVRKVDNPLMSSLLYPILQTLDEEYLGVNCQFGGVDQRKIFIFARSVLPKIDYKPRVYLLNPIIPGLGKPDNEGKAPKMSSSEPNSKIDFEDSNKTIKNKFNKAFSIDGVVENNSILPLLKYVVFRFLETQNRPLVVQREEKYGGNITFNTYDELEACFAKGEIASKDLKNTIANEVIALITPLRDLINGEGKEVYLKAYPPQNVVVTRQTAEEATFACLDIRVGVITQISKHPGADSLYVEKIDVGESEPRQIISGLVPYFTEEQLLGRQVLVICNLPPKKLKGVDSNGMVLAVSVTEGDKKTLDLVVPPENSVPGDKIFCEGVDGEVEPDIKPKRYQRISGFLKSDSEGFPCYKDIKFRTTKGYCRPSIKNGVIS